MREIFNFVIQSVYVDWFSLFEPHTYMFFKGDFIKFCVVYFRATVVRNGSAAHRKCVRRERRSDDVSALNVAAVTVPY